ncbi:sentrin-specific protease 1-like [Olea europaea subsp. europaea]|uniref:Sentrin-specific protease 1-like n=1 Tax=Olea europaea subsp. europaea TaxID=158383 RepID=A0A8S0RVI6_OLEEU|nr:sentrin-specific protease 1-like [Olea europaea subsp. europaea]
MADEQPSTAKLEGPDCFSNPKPTSSTESRRRTKRRTERTVEDVGTSGKLVPLVLPLMESNIGQAHSSDDDDDFVAPPPKRQEPSARGKSPVVEGPIAAHHSQEEPQSHGAQRDDAFEVLRVQVSELQADNKVLKMELEDIKSHMSSLNEGKTNKIEDIIQMQACIRNDLMDIRTNMQFLSESVSTMISSAMDEIIRRSGDRTSEHGVGQKEAPGVGDQEHHGAGGSEKAQEVKNVVSNVDRKGKGKMDPSDDLLFSLEPPSFDLGIEFSPPNILHSEETQKRVDSIICDVVTATKTIENEEREKLFKHDDNVVVFEDYGDSIDEVDKSAFMGWFQRGSHTLTVFNSTCKSYRRWMVLEGIEPYVKVLSALMNTLGISNKDPDYHGPEAKELKVIIDDTLSQQSNGHDCGIFVVLYALYLIRGGRYFILQKFDASKFRMDIATLLYKHRQVYTKKVNQPTMGEAIIIE